MRFVNDINDTNEIHREPPYVVPGCMILENLWNYWNISKSAQQMAIYFHAPVIADDMAVSYTHLDEYAAYDVERALPIHLERPSLDPKGCQCGRVLQGLIKPSECPLFGKSCTADHPVGACMVSVEGSCAAWYKYCLLYTS